MGEEETQLAPDLVQSTLNHISPSDLRPKGFGNRWGFRWTQMELFAFHAVPAKSRKVQTSYFRLVTEWCSDVDWVVTLPSDLLPEVG